MPSLNNAGSNIDWGSYLDSFRDINTALANTGYRAGDFQTTAGAQRPYFANQGTDYMFDNYRSANPLENFAINVHRLGDEAMNWQAGVAGLFGGEQAKEDWTFNPDKFKLADWGGDQGLENLNQLKNFAVSLPGQMVGGLLQAPGQIIGEVVAGSPYTEYKKKTGAAGRRAQNLNEPEFDSNGNYLIPDYTLDAGQRAGQLVNAGINVAGAFTGGAGRVLGSAGKAAFIRGAESSIGKEGLESMAKSFGAQSGKDFAKNIARQGPDAMRAFAPVAGKEAAEKITRYADKMDKWENRSKGLVRRAYESTGRDSDAAGIFAQAGFDALEEAGEEFVQEYAEQGGRYKQNVKFEDALTSAAWGALGGGVASGIGAGINHGANRARETFTNPVERNANPDTAWTYNDDGFVELRNNQGSYLSPEVAKHKSDLLRQSREIAGSGNGTNVRADASYRPHEGAVGVVNIQRIFERDEESAKIVADDFGTTVENMQKIFSGDYSPVGGAVSTRDALLKLVNGKEISIAIGRSPATKNGGSLIYLKDILNDEGIVLNPMTYAQYGSDIDGDKSFIYFNAGRFPALGYSSQFLPDPEKHYDGNGNLTGSSQVPYWYAAITHGFADNPEDFSQRVHSVLDAFDIDIDGESIADVYSKRLLEILQSEDAIGEDARDFQLATAFNDLQNEIIGKKYTDSNGVEGAYTKRQAMDAYGDILAAFGNSPSDIIRAIERERNIRITRNIESVWRAQGNPGSISKYIEDNIIPVLETTGRAEGVNAAIQIYEQAGLVYASLATSGNPIYRQYAQKYYPFGKEIQGKFFDGPRILSQVDSEVLKPVLQTFLRASFGMTSTGIDPTTSVEGIINNFIISDVMRAVNLSNNDSTIETAEQLNALFESFETSYNKYLDILDKSKIDETTLGDQKPSDYIGKNKIERDTDGFWVAFINVFGNLPMRNIIKPDFLPKNIRDMTLSQYIEEFGGRDITFTGHGVMFQGTAFQTFIDNIIDTFGSSKKRIAQSVIDTLSQIDTTSAYRMRNDTGSFGGYLQSIYNIMNAMSGILDPDIALRSGFLDPEAVIDTEIGQILFSPNTSGETRANVLASLSLYTQFERAYNIMIRGIDPETGEEIDTEQNTKIVDSAREELGRLAEISALHAKIAGDILNGDSSTFRVFTAYDKTLNEKQLFLETYVFPLDNRANYITDALTTSDSAFAVNEVTTRTRKAKTYVSSARVKILDDTTRQIKDIRASLTGTTDQQKFINFIRHGANSSLVRINREAMVGQAWESAIIAHAGVEKGTINRAASNKHGMLEIAYNGGLMSFQEDLFGATFGEITLNQARSNQKIIMMCLADPSFSVTVTDPRTGRNGVMNQNTLFNAVPGIQVDPDTEPTFDQWMDFLEANPTIATYLSDTTVNFTEESATPSQDSNFEKSWTNYKQATFGTSGQRIENYKVKDGLVLTERWLLNNPNYVPYLYSVAAPKWEGREFNSKAVRDAILSTHNDIVRAMYLRANSGSIGADSRIFRDNGYTWRKRMENRMLNTITLMNNLISADNELRALAAQDKRNKWKEIGFYSMQDDLIALASERFQVGLDASEIVKTESEYEKLKANTLRAYVLQHADSQARLNQLTQYSIQKRSSGIKDPIPSVNKEQIGEIVRQITNANPSLDEDTVRTFIENEADDLNKRYNDSDAIDLSHLLVSEDDYSSAFDPNATSYNQLIGKISSLYGATGQYASEQTIYDEIQEYLSPDNSKKTRDQLLEEYNQMWVDRMIAHEVALFNSTLSSQINENAVRLYGQIDDFEKAAFDAGNDRKSLINELAEANHLYVAGYDLLEEVLGAHEMPIPTVTSKIAQGMISNARVMDDAAGTNNMVSVNGGQLKLHHGLGFLPGSRNTVTKPRTVTASYLEEARRRDPNVGLHKVIVSGEWSEDGSGYTVDTVNSLLDNPQYSDIFDSGQIQYFNPLRNPHGLSTHHIPEGNTKAVRAWHRITHIIGKIDVETMEGMVMKAKKKLGTAEYVVREKDYNKRNLGSSNSSNISEFNDRSIKEQVPGIRMEGSQYAMQELLVNIREEYANIINEQFNGALKGLKFGLPQAQMLSCFLTPGLRVTVQTSNGTIKECVFDANAIFGDENTWSDYFNTQSSVEENGETVEGRIVSVEQFTVTPENISFRIMRDINSQARNAEKRGNTENIAYDSLDYSNYEFNNLGMSSVLNRLNPNPYSYRRGIKFSDSQTAPQTVLDLATEFSYGATKSGPTATVSKQLEITGKDKELWKTAKNLGKKVHSDNVTGIVKVFGSSEDASRTVFKNVSEQNNFENVNGLLINYSGKGHYANYDEQKNANTNTAVMVMSTDPATVANAVNYAIESGNYLLVPTKNSDPLDRSVESILSNLFHTANSSIVKVDVGVNHQEDFKLFRPQFNPYTSSSSGAKISSHRIVRDSRNIKLTLIDETGLYATGDAGVKMTKFSSRPIGVRGGNYAKIDASSLMSSKGSVRFATHQEALGIIDSFTVNNNLIVSLDPNSGSPATSVFDKNLFNFRDPSRAELERAITEYLECVQNDTLDENGVMRNGAGRYKCLAIVTNGEKYYPIIAPKASNTTYDYCNVIISGNDIFIPWAGSFNLGDATNEDLKHLKVSLYDQIAFKGIVSVFEDPRVSNMRIGTSDLDCDDAISFIISQDTYGSRAVGKRLQNMKQNFYEANLAFSGSIIFNRYENGEIDYNPFIKRMISENKIDVGDIIDFLNGVDSAADKVVSGDLMFTDDPEVNSLIIRVVNNCRNNGQPFASVISRISYMPGSRVLDENGVMTKTFAKDSTDFEFNTAFSGFDENMLMKFYSAMGDVVLDNGMKVKFCPDGIADNECQTEGPGSLPITLFDVDGNTWLNIEDNEGKVSGCFMPILWGEPRVTGEVSDMTLPGNQASIAWQQYTTRGLDQGFRNIDIRDDSDPNRLDVVDYTDFLLGNNEFMSEYARSKAAHKRSRGELDFSFIEDTRTNIEPGMSWGEYERAQNVARNARCLTDPRYVMKDGSIIDTKSADWKLIQSKIDRFKELIKWDMDYMPFSFFDMFIRQQTGATVDADSEYNNVHIDQWLNAADHIIRTTEQRIQQGMKPLPVTVYQTGSNQKNRFAVPALFDYQIDMLMDHSKLYQDSYGSREEFVDNINEEEKQALDLIEKNMPVNRAQSLRLFEFAEFVHRANGTNFTHSKYLYNNVYQADYINMAERYANCLQILGEADQSDIAAIRELMEQNAQRLKDSRDNLENRNRSVTVEDPSSTSGYSTSLYYDANYVENKLLDNATQWVQLMALLDPLMPVANIVDRGVHQTIFRRMLNTAKKNKVTSSILSPYHFRDTSHAFTEEELDNIVNQPQFMELWLAIREAQLHGRGEEFLAEAYSQGDNMIQWLRDQRKVGSKWSQIINGGFRIFSGGRYGTKQQAKIFLDRWVQFVEDSPELSRYWLDPQVDGTSRLKSMTVGGGAANWLIDCLGGNEGQTAVLRQTMGAMQSSRTGDMAQQHTIATIWGDFARNHSAGNLVFTTLVSKFPQYSLNVTHRLLNWVLPMSSAYYVFTDYVAKNTETGRRLHIEDNQFHKNIREALQVDMLHLGASLMAVVLLGISGAIEPPEDDRYMVNQDEWLVLGMRVRDVWWLRDILGMAIPIACFAKSCQLGKPMFPLITDGINEACYSNPFLRATDALEMFINPEGNIFEQYEQAKKDYEKAPGGGPDSVIDFLIANAGANTLRVFGQFTTPAFVRELAQMGDYEHSYKKVYATDKLGAERDDTQTTRVSYSEAMIRKYLRGNPWLATIGDVIFRPSTGFREDEMPLNIYYDDAQMQSMIDNASKNPMAIIDTLQRYQNNMDELRATGFYLDMDTKAAVSQQIWDLYYASKSRWNQFAANEGADFYALGNGSYTYGKQLYYEYKEICQQEQNYWRQFYYDTIKNSYLSEPMQAYYRTKTTYDLDAAGEVYATGFRRNGLIPIPAEFAPGTMTDPQGTAGYGNNFMAVSAVTGGPMGQRALVAVDQDRTEWPDFEEWSANKDGDSYSASYTSEASKQLGSSSAASSSASSSAGTGSRRSSYGSGGGGGGGYSRGGGGGGGGGGYSKSAPRIYGSNASVNPVSPSRLMNTDRVQHSQDISYLRPDFETKGSREAYRRSDI